MGGARRSTHTTHIKDAILEELRAAALARWQSHDTFVWRARRCAEAILYGVVDRANGDVEKLSEQRTTLDSLLRAPEVKAALSDQMQSSAESLRRFGNFGAHFQLEGGVSEDSANGIASFLAGLLREFFELEQDRPENLDRYLAALTDRTARIRSDAEIARDEAMRRIEDLDRSLRSKQSARPSRPGGTRVFLALGLSIAMAAGIGGFAVGRGSTSAERQTSSPIANRDPEAAGERTNRVTSTSALVTAPAPSIPTDAAPLEHPEEDGTAPPPTSPSPRGSASCPVPMLEISGSASPSFCIDPAPVAEGEYRACVAAHQCPRPSRGYGCNWQNGPEFDANAANCIPWSAAASYCRWHRGASAGLPSRDQWIAASSARRLLGLLPETNEWSAESLELGRRVVRGDRDRAGFVESSEIETAGRRHIGFRCVTPPL